MAGKKGGSVKKKQVVAGSMAQNTATTALPSNWS